MESEIKGRQRDGAKRWTLVVPQPQRWECPGFGAIVARGVDLWSFLPVCGHDHYAALSFEDARTRAEQRSGLCYACWQREATRPSSFASGIVPIVPSRSGRGSSAASEHRSPLVLVVDDDIDIREALAELLEDRGYGVLCAANGLEAFDLLRSGALPSVILLDLMMPLMDGYRFLNEQKKDLALAGIPVLVITADASTGADELEAAAVFRKPLELPKLLTAIGQHCAS